MFDDIEKRILARLMREDRLGCGNAWMDWTGRRDNKVIQIMGRN